MYLRFLLIHTGFDVRAINWIMGCIKTVSFVVLNNIAASKFFKLDQGLHQGCPLFLYLFLLVVEVLSRALIAAQRNGVIKV